MYAHMLHIAYKCISCRDQLGLTVNRGPENGGPEKGGPKKGLI